MPSVKHCLKNVSQGWVLGTLNQEDPDFKTLLSYKRTLSEKRKGGGVGGRVEGIASQKVFSLYHLVSVDWYELT